MGRSRRGVAAARTGRHRRRRPARAEPGTAAGTRRGPVPRPGADGEQTKAAAQRMWEENSEEIGRSLPWPTERMREMLHYLDRARRAGEAGPSRQRPPAARFDARKPPCGLLVPTAASATAVGRRGPGQPVRRRTASGRPVSCAAPPAASRPSRTPRRCPGRGWSDVVRRRSTSSTVSAHSWSRA